MKPGLYSISVLLFIKSVLACSNNQLFDLCMQTAKIASTRCEADDAVSICQCSAEKQMLACYSECADEINNLEPYTEQYQQTQSACIQPDAEAERKLLAETRGSDTWSSNPIRVNSESFNVKPKLEATDSTVSADSLPQQHVKEVQIDKKAQEQPSQQQKVQQNDNQSYNNDHAINVIDNAAASKFIFTPLVLILWALLFLVIR